MCIKIDNRIECYEHGYPGSEACYFDDGTLECDDTQENVDLYIEKQSD